MTVAKTIGRIGCLALLFLACHTMAPTVRPAQHATRPSAQLGSTLPLENWAIPADPPGSSDPGLLNYDSLKSPRVLPRDVLPTPSIPLPSMSTEPPSVRVTVPAPPANHQTPANSSGLQIPGVPGSNVPWPIVAMLTGLTLLPALLMCVTPFARLLIVFHFLRQALGLQTTPSNPTLIGLSLILTFYLMHPVATEIFRTAIVPMESGQISAMDAIKVGEVPLRKFMSHYVREQDVALFIDAAKEPRPASVNDLSMHILLPAYILSELKAGFQIGTVLFLPFLIVDMVVASITTSVGMLQLPPVVISTPLKLLLFLMVDGWHLLIGSLIRSFN
jgi:flagellar biosynthetic protein FliP